MRLRSFVFAITCGTATFAVAQTSGYVSFGSPNAEACATACGSDALCASWVYGTRARSYGQYRSGGQNQSGGMCTFTTASTPQSSPGIVSGLPRRTTQTPQSFPAQSGSRGNMTVPSQTMPPQTMPPQTMQSAPRPTNQSNSGWEVRPAPWLSRAPSQNFTPANSGLEPQTQPTRATPAMPSPVPFNAPRIDYDPPRNPSTGGPVVLTPAPLVQAPQIQAPQIQAPQSPMPQTRLPQSQLAPMATPQYAPPSVLQSPIPARPVAVPPRSPNPALIAPPPPPSTEPFPEGAVLVPDAQSPTSVRVPLPTQRRAGSGVPRAAAPSAIMGERVDDVNGPPQTAPVTIAPPRRTARGVPKAKASEPTRPPQPSAATPSNMEPAQTATQEQPPVIAAPPRQIPQVRPAPVAQRRAPVRDPSNPESFRGPDGMIDAAEMRRAQLEAARAQGTPAYSVQREWEAVAAERQRAEDAGEVRVDPLAGTVPVPPPPETAAQRRARIAEEAEIAAEERRQSGEVEEDVEPAARQTRSPTRGARGTPRQRAPRAQSTDTPTASPIGLTQPPTSRTRARAQPAQALDREPRLGGGPI